MYAMQSYLSCLTMVEPTARSRLRPALFTRQTSPVRRHASDVTRQTSPVRRHASDVTRQTSPVTHHPSDVTRQTSLLERLEDEVQPPHALDVPHPRRQPLRPPCRR